MNKLMQIHGSKPATASIAKPRSNMEVMTTPHAQMKPAMMMTNACQMRVAGLRRNSSQADQF